MTKSPPLHVAIPAADGDPSRAARDATTPNGRWVYVPCRDEHYRVVDAERREVVAR